MFGGPATFTSGYQGSTGCVPWGTSIRIALLQFIFCAIHFFCIPVHAKATQTDKREVLPHAGTEAYMGLASVSETLG